MAGTSDREAYTEQAPGARRTQRTETRPSRLRTLPVAGLATLTVLVVSLGALMLIRSERPPSTPEILAARTVTARLTANAPAVATTPATASPKVSQPKTGADVLDIEGEVSYIAVNEWNPEGGDRTRVIKDRKLIDRLTEMVLESPVAEPSPIPSGPPPNLHITFYWHDGPWAREMTFSRKDSWLMPGFIIVPVQFWSVLDDALSPAPGSKPFPSGVNSPLAVPKRFLQELGLSGGMFALVPSGGGAPILQKYRRKTIFWTGWGSNSEHGLSGVTDERFEFGSVEDARAFLPHIVPEAVERGFPTPTLLESDLRLGEETLVYHLPWPNSRMQTYYFAFRVENIVAKVAVSGDNALTKDGAIEIARAAGEQMAEALKG